MGGQSPPIGQTTHKQETPSYERQSLGVTDPGDTILLPDPGYPSYFGAAALAGLQVVTMPLCEE
jgi:hypothetical protein